MGVDGTEEVAANSSPEEKGHASSPADAVPDGGFTAWLQVAGTFSVYLNTWGVANTYGVFQTYYQLNTLRTESASNIAWIGSIQGSFLLIVSFVAGPLYDAGYARSLLCLGSFLTVFSMMMTSICGTYWEFILAQGIAFGVGNGLLYLPGAGIISQYFKKNSSIAFGIGTMGSSIGPVIFPVIFRQLEPPLGFGWTTRVIAFIMLGVSVIPMAGMKQRIPSTKLRQILDVALFRDKPYLLFCAAEFFGVMGLYIAFFYVQLYALSKCNTSPRVAALLLPIVSAGSFFGRLVPNYLSDKFTGPMNMQIPFAFATAILAFAWIAVRSTGGVITFSVLYGFASGAFLSLGGPICFSLSSDSGTVGTRLGILTGFCGIALLVGNPIAGAILDSGMANLSDPDRLTEILRRYRPNLTLYEEYYKAFHRDPELSRQESRTARIAADFLNDIGSYRVTEKIGGHGVVGVFENGPGPKVLLRADMDALPVPELTGLEYASKKKGVDPEGNQVSVMHACGHDMHVASLMAVAKVMAAAREHWTGTLIVLFQPNEELAGGAQAMVDDGLYGEKHKIPIPDIVLGQHVLVIKAGTVGLAAGPVLAAVDSLSIRIWGRGGHGTNAQKCIDPVLTAAHIVVRLQSIVRTEAAPSELAVLSVGSIRAGDTSNVIPDFADIKLTIRSYLPHVHERMLAATHRIVRAECDASGCERPPEFETIMHAPATINDGPSVEKLSSAFDTYFGEASTVMDPNPGSEDFSVLARAVDKPYIWWLFGGVDEKIWDDAVQKKKLQDLPYNHSSLYAPVLQPTLETGVDSFTVAALTFLGKK